MGNVGQQRPLVTRDSVCLKTLLNPNFGTTKHSPTCPLDGRLHARQTRCKASSTTQDAVGLACFFRKVERASLAGSKGEHGNRSRNFF